METAGRVSSAVLTCLAAGCLAWFGCRGASSPTSRDPALDEAIRQVRAGATRRIELDVVAQDADLAALAELVQLEELVLPAARVSDEGLQQLSELTRLVRLDLGGGGAVTDAGLASLRGLKQLRLLNLHVTRLTDAGLEHLRQFPQLQQLRLGGSYITDQGVQTLAALPNLRFVHLLDLPLTDAGLEHLHGMKQLESLYLDHVQVTDDGISRLLTALPQLHVHLDESHPSGVEQDHEH